MSRTAKTTLGASIVLSALTVFGVHFMQIQERAVMYKGVERDEARQAAKRAQRQLDLEENQAREEAFQKIQPTAKYVAAHSVFEEAEKKAGYVKEKAGSLLELGGIGGDEDRRYIAGRWGFNGLQALAIAATPLYLISAGRRGTFSLRGLARSNFTTPLLGGAAGYAGGYVYANTLSTSDAATKSFNIRHDPAVIRRDDYYIIGAVLGALLTPALFLGRTGLIRGALGGGLGLGGSGGLAYSFIQGQSSDALVSKGEKVLNKVESATGTSTTESSRSLSGQAKGKAEELRGKALDLLGGK